MISLRDIPFSQFQRLWVDGDTSILPEGTTDEEVRGLLEEHKKLTSSRKGNQAGLAEGNLIFWTARIQQLQILIDLLNEMYIPEVAEMIREEFDYPLTEETYKADLQSIVSESQQWDVKRMEYEATISALAPKDGEKITYEYCARVTNAISTMIGGNIPDDINTMRWDQYYAQLIQNAEKSNKDGKSGQH